MYLKKGFHLTCHDFIQQITATERELVVEIKWSHWQNVKNGFNACTFGFFLSHTSAWIFYPRSQLTSQTTFFLSLIYSLATNCYYFIVLMLGRVASIHCRCSWRQNRVLLTCELDFNAFMEHLCTYSWRHWYSAEDSEPTCHMNAMSVSPFQMMLFLLS